MLEKEIRKIFEELANMVNELENKHMSMPYVYAIKEFEVFHDYITNGIIQTNKVR